MADFASSDRSVTSPRSEKEHRPRDILCSVHQGKGIGILCGSCNTKICLQCCVDNHQLFHENGESSISLEELKETLVKKEMAGLETQAGCASLGSPEGKATDADMRGTEAAHADNQCWSELKEKAVAATSRCQDVLQEIYFFLEDQVAAIQAYMTEIPPLTPFFSFLVFIISAFTILQISGYSQCASSPCQNGGACYMEEELALCTCPERFTGKTCETEINHCMSNPCWNGATCTNVPGSFKCLCALGFTGETCSSGIDDCFPNPCQNGGTCFDGRGSFSCSCSEGFTGATCGVEIDDCSPNPCRNGGICHDALESFSCICPEGFTGDTCNVDIAKSASDLCQNGGTLTCNCPSEYQGDRCEIHKALYCPIGWKLFRGQCYLFSFGKTSWFASREICRSELSELVHIHDSVENHFVKRNMPSRSWIGLNDDMYEGTFVWTDGQENLFLVDYRNWESREPNNVKSSWGISDEDCVSMLSSGRWNDCFCGDLYHYVCKKRAVPV